MKDLKLGDAIPVAVFLMTLTVAAAVPDLPGLNRMIARFAATEIAADTSI